MELFVDTAEDTCDVQMYRDTKVENYCWRAWLFVDLKKEQITRQNNWFWKSGLVFSVIRNITPANAEKNLWLISPTFYWAQLCQYSCAKKFLNLNCKHKKNFAKKRIKKLSVKCCKNCHLESILPKIFLRQMNIVTVF